MLTTTRATSGTQLGAIGVPSRNQNLDSGIPLRDGDLLANYEVNKVQIEFGGKNKPSRIFMI